MVRSGDSRRPSSTSRKPRHLHKNPRAWRPSGGVSSVSSRSRLVLVLCSVLAHCPRRGSRVLVPFPLRLLIVPASWLSLGPLVPWCFASSRLPSLRDPCSPTCGSHLRTLGDRSSLKVPGCPAAARAWSVSTCSRARAAALCSRPVAPAAHPAHHASLSLRSLSPRGSVPDRPCSSRPRSLAQPFTRLRLYRPCQSSFSTASPTDSVRPKGEGCWPRAVEDGGVVSVCEGSRTGCCDPSVFCGVDAWSSS